MVFRWWRLSSLALTLFLATLSLDSARAQSFYASTGYGDLVHYELSTQTFTNIGPIKHNGNTIIMLDIASDYDGNLYGGSWNGTYYQIDKKTAAATPVANVSVAPVALVFKPDGTLWAVGGINTLYKINLATSSYQLVTPLAASPSGDLAFNPKTGLLYMSSPGAGGDRILEINTTTGAISSKGNFLYGGVYGMDFSGDGEKLIGCSTTEMLHMDIDPNKTWSPRVNHPSSASPCFGFTKDHCKTVPVITLNGDEVTDANLQCGADAIVDGSSSQNVISYEWKISGTNVAGALKTITINGKGTPGAIDLLHDPRLTELDFLVTKEQTGRDFTIELTTACDPFEKTATTELSLHTRAISLSWESTPSGNEHYFGTPITFKDTGSAFWESAKWSIDGIQRETGAQYQKTFNSQEIGPHTVTYEVTHSNKCISTETRPLNILDGLAYVPNAFSPNGDGNNDKLSVHIVPGVQTIDLSHIDFSVFNRWGARVFHGNGLDVAWDGTLNGQPQEVGTYQYVVRYKMQNGAEHFLKGDVTLIR